MSESELPVDLSSDILEDSTVVEDLESISSLLHDAVEDLSDISDSIRSLSGEQSTDLGAASSVVDSNLDTFANSKLNEVFVEASTSKFSIKQAINDLPPIKLTKSTSANSSPVKTRKGSSTHSYSVKERIQLFDPISCSTKVTSRSLGCLSESSKINPP